MNSIYTTVMILYYTINLSLDNAYTAVERMQESLSTVALQEITGEYKL